MAEMKQNEYQIPEALDSFDAIIPNKNPLLLFLDYDGTLAEIVADPDKAVLSDSMSKLLTQLSSMDNIHLVIVTGRSIEKVRSFIANHKDIHFAGNHGIEIEFAGGGDPQLFVGKESVKLLNTAYTALTANKVCETYPGTQIEYKTYSLSLHYRNMKVDDEQKAISEIEEMMTGLSKQHELHLSVGKKLFELKCVNDWNKGYAIKWMLERKEEIFKLKGDVESYNVMFIGDDVTDEDGFHALLEYGKGAESKDNISTVLVTHGKVRDTKAAYRLETVSDVETLLTKIGETLK